MSFCLSLTFLTLSDTPISVRRYYRHHVINTIWSLKALDRHVVSDEEIIEGARFGGRFSAQSQAFQLPSSAFKVSRCFINYFKFSSVRYFYCSIVPYQWLGHLSGWPSTENVLSWPTTSTFHQRLKLFCFARADWNTSGWISWWGMVTV